MNNFTSAPCWLSLLWIMWTRLKIVTERTNIALFFMEDGCSDRTTLVKVKIRMDTSHIAQREPTRKWLPFFFFSIRSNFTLWVTINIRYALVILEMTQVQKVKWCMKQTLVRDPPSSTYIWLTQFDKHKIFDSVMVSVIGSIPTGGNFLLEVFKTPQCKFRLKMWIWSCHEKLNSITKILYMKASPLVFETNNKKLLKIYLSSFFVT